jgi:signal transduction histidine kinase
MRSIRRVLLVWLLGIVLIGVVLAGVLIYRQAQAEANALFDYQLQQTAAALPSEPFSSVLGTRSGEGEGVVIQIWSNEGVELYRSRPRAPLAPRAELGFSTERTPQGDWRVYSAIVGDNVVQLAQPMVIRNLLAAETAWRTVWPLLILLPVLGIGVWLIVGRGLRPLSRLARSLEARRPGAVDPLPDGRLPTEIRPVIHALNGLLSRLNGALDTQKAFVADAAHELRTPLAALRIQTQLLERARDDAGRAEALVDLKTGVDRATRLVEQLLSLARAEAPGSGSAADSRVDPERHAGMGGEPRMPASGDRGAMSGSGMARETDSGADQRVARAGDAVANHAAPLAPGSVGNQVSSQASHHATGLAAGLTTAPESASVMSLSQGSPGSPGSRSPVDLRRVVESCVALHAPLAIDKGVDLGIEDAQAVRLQGDADALRVMIGNLLDNAVKYTPPGGRVDVSFGWLDEGERVLTTYAGPAASGRDDARWAYLDIIDTGPGIAPVERERVFDRFYRSPDAIDATGAGGAQGSGLGLAIVKRIADAHQARVLLSSRSELLAPAPAKATAEAAAVLPRGDQPEVRDALEPLGAAAGLRVRVLFPLAHTLL